MIIREATQNDIDQLLELLSQVLELHARIRPDVFIPGSVKYPRNELEKMVGDGLHLIYVACEGDIVIGYAFCDVRAPVLPSMKPIKKFFIDDFCVRDGYQRQHVGTTIFEHLKKEANRFGCESITLSCWEGNDVARSFYEHMGMTPRTTTMELYVKE